MTQQIIGVGTSPNDGLGNPIRTAFIKTNSNFSELYARAQVAPPPTLYGSLGDEAGWYAYDSNYFYYCFANYTDGANEIWRQIAQIGNVTVTTIADGTSNVAIADINGNAVTSINGTPNVVIVAQTGQFVRGVVSATGNVTGSYILGNGSQLSGLPATYTNSNVTALLADLGGNPISSVANITTSANINGVGITANVITSSGNISTPAQISATGNITTAGYFVGNFIGNIIATISNLPGPNGAVVYNNGSGNAAATSGMVFNSGSNTLTVLGSYSAGGNVVAAGYVSVTGNVTGGNLLTGGLISAAGGINTATTVIATGNIRGGNIISNGTITATGNLVGLNLTTGGQVSAAGNITGGNLSITTSINAGGNISASNFTGTAISVAGNIVAGNISTTGQFSVSSASVAGNITSSNVVTGNNISVGRGLLVGNVYTGSFPDGMVMDYDLVGGNGRISSAENDGLQFYNQGLGNVWLGGFQPNGTFSATGNVVAAKNLTVGGLFINANTISSNTGAITLGQVGSTGDVIIVGNLTVNGTTTTINSTSVVINDIALQLANSASSASDANGAGFGVGPGFIYGSFTYDSFSNAWVTGLGITASGNIAGGNVTTNANVVAASSLKVNANNGVTAIVNNGTNGVGNIGASGATFNTVFAKATTAQYADLAENYIADADYAPGTVVIFGGDKEITISTDVADERVAGAISTDPAYLMNTGMAGLPVALRGRIPVNVIGPVTKGDSLVTSSTAGYAQSVGRSRLYGQAVFAKALETNLEDGEKTIIAVIL